MSMNFHRKITLNNRLVGTITSILSVCNRKCRVTLQFIAYRMTARLLGVLVTDGFSLVLSLQNVSLLPLPVIAYWST